ncbi:Fusaric acid resistance protein-like-domain-containing protein [Phakopsora pachyrhizi]|nr:Fusaric acid resistance protein-like-domain-containing protein [Phakopsora pachyrhizi]
MSSWAVFEAVMGQESFSRSMVTSQRPSSLRFCSPDRILSLEPDPVINSPQDPRHDRNHPEDPHHPDLLNPSFLVNSSNPILRSEPSIDSPPPTSFLTSLASVVTWLLPDSFRSQFRVILKCSIAYLIASLFSFYDPLSDLLVLPFGLDGPFSGAHVIATIVTYYRPANTIGGMMQANHFAFWGLVWLIVLVVGSTLTSVVIENRTISHAIVLVVFVGFGYGTAAWVKQKSPVFSSTCSMIILISAVIITREGSIHYGYLDFKKTLIYSEIVVIGMLISNLTCIGFWRGSATGQLQNNINSTIESFTTLIGMLTKTFLLDETIYADQEGLKKAIDKHLASFTSLKQSLDAASYDFFEPKIQRSQSSYKELVDSMNRLAQHLAGLRSGCGLQHEIMEAARVKKGCDHPDSQSIRSGISSSSDFEPTKQVFVAFCESIGPELKTLMAIGVACLHEIRTPSENLPLSGIAEEGGCNSVDQIMRMRSQLTISLQAFEESHSLAMRKLYFDYCKRSNANIERVPSSDCLSHYQISPPNEGIFVICFFLFNMEEFMKELCHLLDLFAEIREDEEAIAYESQIRRRKYWNKVKSLCCWRKSHTSYYKPKPKPKPRRQRPKLTAVLPLDPKKISPIPVSQSSSKKKSGEQNLTLLSGYRAKFKRAIYDFFEGLNDPDVKIAIKVGAGAALLMLPAFLDVTRPLFHQYRGQWAVITYMIVTASTLGQTNFLVVTRTLGTLAGSIVALIAYHIFWEDPVALPLVGFLYSIPCYWLVVCFPRFAPTGRFLLLTYNLVCVYSYNVRDDNVHILVTAYRRVMCVLFGVFFGWVVNNYIWPYKARRELRKCLSEFLLECAFLYTYVVKRYSSSADEPERDDEPEGNIVAGGTAANDEDAPLLNQNFKTENDRIKAKLETTEFSNMELFLQVKLNRLFNLLSATQHEPRLKGPFPTERYRTMLNGCQSLLDTIHSLGSVTSRKDWFKSMRKEFLLPVKAEHKDMVGNLLLYFGLLSTSIELKSPLPPYLPPANQARQRLFNKIKKLTENDYFLLLFAFLVALKKIVKELELIGVEAQSLFGIIGGSNNLNEFEQIFV